MADTQKLAISGAIAGASTFYILKFAVRPILDMFGSFMPTLSVKLANPTIAINIRESLTGIQGGLAGWLMDAIGVTVPVNTMTNLLMSAFGGALLFVAGGFLAETLGLLKGSAKEKTTATIFAGSVLAAVVLGSIGIPPQLNFTLVNLLIAFGINAAILSWLYGVIDSKADMGLIPY